MAWESGKGCLFGISRVLTSVVNSLERKELNEALSGFISSTISGPSKLEQYLRKM